MYSSLPPTRTDLGYQWNEASIEDVLHSLGGFLSRNKAKAYMMDVYASSGDVYRSMIIQLPKLEFFPPESIFIRFNKYEGRQWTLVKAEES